MTNQTRNAPLFTIDRQMVLFWRTGINLNASGAGLRGAHGRETRATAGGVRPPASGVTAKSDRRSGPVHNIKILQAQWRGYSSRQGPSGQEGARLRGRVEAQACSMADWRPSPRSTYQKRRTQCSPPGRTSSSDRRRGAQPGLRPAVQRLTEQLRLVGACAPVEVMG